ncbi:MAG TPA: histidine phosphatase family protein [Propionibacteriaceae bacterium]|nr:histidine phosphatase family protein [Propionibacteriaceae bacterium]
MSIKQLILVRHGESTGNVAAAQAYTDRAEVIDIGLRDADVPLSEPGVQQARGLGARWAKEDPDALPTSVWCSPYLRAVQTAQIALEVAGLDLPFVIDERLRDRELGVLDLLTLEGVAARFPGEAERRRWLGKFYHRPPGGESYADLILRIRSFLRDLDDEPGADRALVVCHDAVVLSVRYVCERLSEASVLDIGRQTPVLNVSLTRLERAGEGGWRLLDFNDVRHLEARDAPVTEHAGDVDA